MLFIWDERNLEYIAEHGISPQEAKEVVVWARRPYPCRLSDVKWIAKGRTMSGRRLQVTYVFGEPEEIDPRLLTVEELAALEAGERIIYVIHSRPLRREER